MFGLFSSQSRRVMTRARRYAAGRHGFIGSLHLLLALADFFSDIELRKRVQGHVELVMDREYPRRDMRRGQLPFLPSVRGILERAGEIGRAEGEISLSMLLEAMLEQDEDPAAQALAELGVDASVWFRKSAAELAVSMYWGSSGTWTWSRILCALVALAYVGWGVWLVWAYVTHR